MQKIKQFTLIILAVPFLLLPIRANTASLERVINIKDISGPNFIVTESVGFFIDFDFSQVAFGSIISASLSIYLEEARNISPTTEFIFYPFKIRNGKLEVEEKGIIIKIPTKPNNYIDFILPLEIFKDFENVSTLGFVIQPLGEGDFVFHGPYRWGFEDEDKMPVLIIEYTEEGKTIKGMISKYFDIEDDDKTRISKILENTNIITSEVKREKWHEKWYSIFAIGFLAGFLANVVYGHRNKIIVFIKNLQKR